MTIPFSQFLNKRNTYKDIFAKASECEIDNTNLESPAHHILNNFKNKLFNKRMKRKLSYIVTDINFLEMCKNRNNVNTIIENILCGYWFRKQYIDDFLVEKIRNDCAKRKVIFLNINALNYCLDLEEKGDYCDHAICAILAPIKYTKQYNLYYMNPHGNVIKPYTYFEQYVTKKRRKKYDFDKNTVDYFVLKSITEYCYTKYKLIIRYTMSNYHNYYGVNLQEWDNRGTCFIFPSLIYLYLGLYFTKKRELVINNKKKIIPRVEYLLKNGQFNLFVHSCLIDFNLELKRVIFYSLNNTTTDDMKTLLKLEKCLEKSTFHFLKNICGTIVNLIYSYYNNN